MVLHRKIRTAKNLTKYYGLVGLFKGVDNKIHKRDLLNNIMPKNKRINTILKNKDKVQVLYICERNGFYGTPRYRAYNVTEMLSESEKYNVTFAFENELVFFAKYLKYFKIIVAVRIFYNRESFAFLDAAKANGSKIIVDIDDLAYDFTALAKVIDMKVPENENYWRNYSNNIYSMLLKCDYITTTNEFLAHNLRSSFKKGVFVLPNSINNVQLKEALKSKKSKKKILGYFSGTNTHQKDFKIIAKPIAKILEKNPDVYLEIVGELDVPFCLKPYRKQIIKKPLMNIGELQKEIGKVLINLVPLELNNFTNCKSELKFFEAAIAKTITIASPSKVFSKVINNSVNGYLAKNEHDWYTKMKNIISGKYNKKIVDHAFKFAYANYYVKSLTKRIEHIFESVLANKRITIDSYIFTKKLNHPICIDSKLKPAFKLNNYLRSQKRRHLIFAKNHILNKIKQKLKKILKKQTFNADGLLSPILPCASRLHLKRKRINLLIPSINEQNIYGGVATALSFFIKLIESNNYDGRIILTSDPPVNLTKEVSEKFKIINCYDDSNNNRQIIDMSNRSKKMLFVAKNDVFLATIWWTAYEIKDLLSWQKNTFKMQNQKMLYLIQDYEPGFYNWSSQFLLADSTYKMKTHTIALFNSSYLKKYFETNGYSFYKSFVFDPVLSPVLRKRLAKADRNRPRARKRQIIFYGRPGTPRNAFELIIEALRKWSATFDDQHDWKIYSIGERHFNVDLPCRRKIESLGKLSLDKYADILLESYIGISLMVSPHPSYPPLEMSTFGVKTITNSFANKNLQNFNDNIISLNNPSPDNLADAIKSLCSKFDGKSKLAMDTSYVKNKNKFNSVIKNIDDVI